MLFQDFTSNDRAANRNNVSFSETDQTNIGVHVLHELVNPTKRWSVPDHFRDVSDEWPWSRTRREWEVLTSFLVGSPFLKFYNSTDNGNEEGDKEDFGSIVHGGRGGEGGRGGCGGGDVHGHIGVALNNSSPGL